MSTMDRSFPRDLEALSDIHDFVEGYVAAKGIAPSNAHWVAFVVHELFTNMVRYSAEGRKDIAVCLTSRADEIVIRVTDFDVEAFDLTKAPDVEIERWVNEDRVGGLGIHLVRQIADTIAYEYENRTSVITVTRKLEQAELIIDAQKKLALALEQTLSEPKDKS